MKTKQMAANEAIGARSTRPRLVIDPNTKKPTAESLKEQADFKARIVDQTEKPPEVSNIEEPEKKG